MAAARSLDAETRELALKRHMGLVRSLARRYGNLGVPVEDLVQEGAIGLLEAIDRYDPDRKIDFEAFARFRVRRAIRNALTDQARVVRLPKQIVERRRALACAEARLVAATARTPTPTELAAATGLSEAAVLEAQAAAITPMSLDEPVALDGSRLESLVADSAALDPEREVLMAEQKQLVRDAVANLSQRRRAVVSRHFGLDGTEAEIAAVAAQLQLSERRTRTIERDALYELRNALEVAR